MQIVDYGEHIHDPEKMAKLNFDHITNGIFIGNNLCCQMGLSEKLKEEKIEVDISLDNEQLDQPYGVKTFIWIPVKDGLTPDPDMLHFGAQSLAQFVKTNTKVYVHCKKGHGRSASLVMAYLLLAGKTFEEAFEIIKNSREDIHLNETQVANLKSFATEYLV